MKLFLKYIGEFLRTYPQIRFTRNDEILIRESVMKHLGLDNLNQLRDRYEGQAFFEKTMMNVGGLISIQKHLNLPIVDFTTINLKDFQPKINLNGDLVDVHVFEFGSLPLINIDNIKRPVFFVIKKDHITFTICGLATKDVVRENLERTHIEKSSTVNNMSFIGFKHLKHIDTVAVNK
ncbi:hypothetical protein [uncultured Psychroserpens sp.]|uniref:hypothetical protein n=1 Tax=uncultured Psychroserpens sp. TaxID=255436 RepID=UPI00262FBE89|nr:hypothetical protein [uncultured Psychroserpens sp.]